MFARKPLEFFTVVVLSVAAVAVKCQLEWLKYAYNTIASRGSASVSKWLLMFSHVGLFVYNGGQSCHVLESLYA